MLISGLQMRSALSSFGLDSCTPLTASSCSTQESVFISDYYSGAQTIVGVLQVVPVLAGVLIGAPMVARELESGTFRLSWTQGCGRTRWLIARLVLVAVLLAAGAAAVSALFSWYYHPLLQLGQDSPLSPLVFDLRGVAFAGLDAAGVHHRRVRWRAASGAPSRPSPPPPRPGPGCSSRISSTCERHYQAPLTGTGLINPASGTGQGVPWLLSQWWTAPGGVPASQGEINHLSTQLRQAGGLPTPQAVQQWFAEQGYLKYFTYQPASRFWPFQLIEGGWLLALCLLLGGATIWLIRHRAT